jgi:Carboxypeptidase regulatory-like domain
MRLVSRASAYVLGALVGVIVLSASASAQTGASGIAGVVKDTSGAVLPGVTVEAASPALIEKVRTVVTDGEGQFKIVDLRPGTYTVTFGLPGFATVVRDGIALTANFTAAINAELKVGSVSETVTVSGLSPVVDVQNVATRNQISRETLDTVPTNKTLEAFAALTPGIKMQTGIGQDVGGSKGETYVQLTIHGSRTGDSKTVLDGFETNDWSGRVFVPNPASAGEVSVELGNGAGEAPANGVYVNFVPRDGANTFSGTFFATGAGSGLQSEPKLSDDMIARGLKQSDLGGILHIWDVNGSVGGPLAHDKLWFHHATRSWGSANSVVGAYYTLNPTAWTYAPDPSRPAFDNFRNWITSERLTWQASSKNKINLSYDQEYRCDCHRSVSALLTPEATAIRQYHPKILSATWSYPMTNRLLFSAGSNYQTLDYRPGPQPETPLETIGVVDSGLSNLRYRAVGPDTTGSGGYGNKGNTIVNSRFLMSYVTGSHNFQAGMQMRNGVKKFGEEGAASDYTFRTANGVTLPTQITLYAYPLLFHETMKALMGVYVQDQWTRNRLTLNGGLRFDYENALVPAQHLDAGPFIGVRDYEAVNCVPCWKDLSPRMSAAYDLFGNGRTALKVSVGRYTTEEMLNTAHNNNSLLLANSSTARSWNDLTYPVGDPRRANFVPDCDLKDPAINGECGPYANPNFGKTIVTNHYDPALLNGFRPYNWATSAVVQHELTHGMALNVGYFRTSWYNQTATDALGVTPADFDPYCLTLPVDSRFPNGGGNTLCGLYNVKPDKFSSLSGNNFITKATNFGKQTDIYSGMDMTVAARLRNGTQLQGGLNTGRQATSACAVIDSPSATVASTQNNPTGFCEVTPPFWRPELKISGSTHLPYGVQVSAVYQQIPGIAISTSYVATNAEVRGSLNRDLSGSASTVTVSNVIPQSTFYEPNGLKQLDIRLIRNFKLGRTRLQGIFDIYNATNGTSILSETTAYGSSYRKPTAVLDPRIMKFGLQMNF